MDSLNGFPSFNSWENSRMHLMGTMWIHYIGHHISLSEIIISEKNVHGKLTRQVFEPTVDILPPATLLSEGLYLSGQIGTPIDG